MLQSTRAKTVRSSRSGPGTRLMAAGQAGARIVWRPARPDASSNPCLGAGHLPWPCCCTRPCSMPFSIQALVGSSQRHPFNPSLDTRCRPIRLRKTRDAVKQRAAASSALCELRSESHSDCCTVLLRHPNSHTAQRSLDPPR